MLSWYPHLYVGEKARKSQGDLINKLKEQTFPGRAYVITFPYNEANQLEILPARELMQSVVYRRTPMIVGLAADRKEAFDLLDQIVKETLEIRGDADLKAYLRSRLK